MFLRIHIFHLSVKFFKKGEKIAHFEEYYAGFIGVAIGDQ
jgi:hypothetical protein